MPAPEYEELGSNYGYGGFDITPHDTNPLPVIPRAIRVNGDAGDFTFYYANGDGPFTWPVDAKEMLNIAVSRVLLTGTTATGLHAIK